MKWASSEGSGLEAIPWKMGVLPPPLALIFCNRGRICELKLIWLYLPFRAISHLVVLPSVDGERQRRAKSAKEFAACA